MKNRTLRIFTLAVLTGALLAILYFAILENQDAQAASITSQQTITLMDGATAYTTTATTDAIYTAYYGEMTVYVSNIVSGTSTVTVTPQIALQPVACASVTEWTTATVSAVSSTPTYDTAEVQFAIAGDDSVVVSLPTQGRCTRLRLDLSASDTYTPTAYVRLVNSQ